MTYQNLKKENKTEEQIKQLEEGLENNDKKIKALELKTDNLLPKEFMKHNHSGGNYKRINAKDLSGGIKAERVGIVNDSICLKIGDYYLWIDSTGDLRIKSSEPTTDTDGIVIGTQT